MEWTRRELWQAGLASVALAGPAVGNTTGQQAAQSDAAAISPERRILTDMISGLRWSQMLSVAARLQLADRLRGGPLPVRTLAEATGSHEDALYRVLRALASRGVFAEEPDRRFRLTPAAELLLSDVPGSLRLTAHVMGEDWYWNAWGALSHTVATGETAFDHVFGQNTWDWFAAHPTAGALFNAFQTEGTLASTEDVLGAYDFGRYLLVADVGGGEGMLLSAILARHPNARGMLFDLPHVIADARRRVPDDVAARVEFVAGDFFRAVPHGADLYVLKFIIHDWPDAKALEILASCRRAMKRGAALLLVDQVVCGRNEPCESKPSDVAMMVRNGVRNRTELEYRALLDSSGFSVAHVGSTSRGLGLFTAVPE